MDLEKYTSEPENEVFINKETSQRKGDYYY